MLLEDIKFCNDGIDATHIEQRDYCENNKESDAEENNPIFLIPFGSGGDIGIAHGMDARKRSRMEGKMAHRACPRWLRRFFSSEDSSAEVQLWVGIKKSGS